MLINMVFWNHIKKKERKDFIKIIKKWLIDDMDKIDKKQPLNLERINLLFID